MHLVTNKIKLDESYNLIVEKLDREDALFKNMYQAQCRVTLQLEKKGTINNYVNLNRTSKLEEDDQRCIIMPDKINNLKQTVVSIIIEDENDNSPQFKESNLIVGYPEEKLVAAISATSLTTVEVKFLLLKIIQRAIAIFFCFDYRQLMLIQVLTRRFSTN